MPAEVIQTQYDNLQKVADRFARQADVQQQLQQRVAKALQALQNGGWQGKGSAAFFGEMNGKVLPVLRRLQQALDQAQRSTQEIKQIVKAAEEEASKPFRTGEKQEMPAGKNGDNNGGVWGKISEWVHGGLDIAGFAPGLGIFADGANALIYLAEGRFVEAGISLVAVVPVFGDSIKAGTMAAKAGKEVVEAGAERLAKEGVERLTVDAAKAAIDKYLHDPVAETAAKKLGSLGNTTSREARELIDDLALRSTRGSGDRVVLGEWHGLGDNMPNLANSKGYITDAVNNGGVYYHTANNVYEGMNVNEKAAWAVNEQFLRKQAEARIPRFDYVSGNVDEVLSDFALTEKPRFKELEWLQDNGWKYGYVREGNSWVYRAE